MTLVGHWKPFKRRQLRPHRNDGLEIVYVMHGHLRWQVEDHEEDVPPDSIFFTLPWEIHGGVSEVEPGSELYFVVIPLDRAYERRPVSFEFNTALQLKRSESEEIASVLMEAKRRAHPASAEAAWLMRQIHTESHTQARGHIAQIRRYLGGLIQALVRCVLHTEEEQGLKTVVELKPFLKMLRERCHEPWTLSRMAAYCGLGRTRFASLLKRETGDTPVMVLNRLRVEKACRELGKTKASITQIAFDCGFESSQYFARVFKAYAGQSASAYRLQHKPS
jgi:AraC family L-rhamnose operon regulatory protein RhaS